MSDIYAGYIPNYGRNFSFDNDPNSVLNYRPTQSAAVGGSGLTQYNPVTGQLQTPSGSTTGTGTSTIGGTGSFSDTLGMNIPTFQLGLSGLSTLGNLYGAFQANKLANSQFDYTKKITDTNLANSIKSYNTTLSDRANARASVEGWSDSQTSDYINKNKL